MDVAHGTSVTSSTLSWPNCLLAIQSTSPGKLTSRTSVVSTRVQTQNGTTVLSKTTVLSTGPKRDKKGKAHLQERNAIQFTRGPAQRGKIRHG